MSARCWVLRDRARLFGVLAVPLGLSLFPFWGSGGGYRPYFENYTVDASIFELIFDRFRKMILKIISQFLTIRTHVVSSL